MGALARNTDERREEMILAHYPMVRKVAYRMVSRFPSCVEADDLVTIGTLGLIDAVDKFDMSRSISFSAYARIRVQGAILDELRKEDWVPRSVRNRNSKLRGMRDTLKEQLGRDPSHGELAQAMKVTCERLTEIIEDSNIRTLVSMEEKTPGSEEHISELLVSSTATPMEEATRSHVAAIVREALLTLPERERYLVDLYYFRDLTFKEIGEILDVSESRVSQLHTRMKARLGSKLQAAVEQD
jgi:RNA polymerase sigma factor for flagellar operon FliA